jgi:flavin reductase (DIM6/NTAB) family NADH-FMN oxidoreductase RutF
VDFDFSRLPANVCYKLLVGLVVPRPIALVTSLGTDGVVNAAPFSFFNLMGDDPPILVISVERKAGGAVKDTARNILAQQEFVVNLVDEATADRMHHCATDFPSDVSEPAQVGFTTVASSAIRTPRLAESPVSLECVLYQDIPIGENRRLLIGRVVWLHCHEGVVDPQTLRVNMNNYFPVGRLYADRYVRSRDQFSVDSSPDYLASVRTQGRL